MTRFWNKDRYKVIEMRQRLYRIKELAHRLDRLTVGRRTFDEKQVLDVISIALCIGRLSNLTKEQEQ